LTWGQVQKFFTPGDGGKGKGGRGWEIKGIKGAVIYMGGQSGGGYVVEKTYNNVNRSKTSGGKSGTRRTKTSSVAHA